jgi:hypothetical protein
MTILVDEDDAGGFKGCAYGGEVVGDRYALARFEIPQR